MRGEIEGTRDIVLNFRFHEKCSSSKLTKESSSTSKDVYVFMVFCQLKEDVTKNYSWVIYKTFCEIREFLKQVCKFSYNSI